LEMGREEAYQWTKGAFAHSKKPNPKNLPNMQMKVESKKASWCWNLGVGGNNKKGNKAYGQNNEWKS
jgi:hypothetical protein